jgi:hypothetical protein
VPCHFRVRTYNLPGQEAVRCREVRGGRSVNRQLGVPRAASKQKVSTGQRRGRPIAAYPWASCREREEKNQELKLLLLFFFERNEGWTTQPSNQAGLISIRGQSYFGGPVTIWKEKRWA